MSRFTPLNLSNLPVPDVIEETDFEDELAELKVDLVDRGRANGIDLAPAVNVETEPANLILQAVAAAITKRKASDNDKVRALTLADAIGAELDHIGATYYGIKRLIVVPEDTGTTPPTPAVLEGDDAFRDRIALAPEAHSTAGAEGGYIFHALELDGVADISDVAPYSKEDGATYTAGLCADAYSMGLRAAPFDGRLTGDPVEAAEALIVILPRPEYGPCDQALLDRTFTALSRKDVRPMTDNVRVEPASREGYGVAARLVIGQGASSSVVLDAARSSLAAYTAERRRIAAKVTRIGLGAALKVAGVTEVDLTSPANDIDPGSKGFAELDGEPTLTTAPEAAGWRS